MVFTKKKLQRCPESTFRNHYSLGVTSSMLPELQQNTICIGATAIPPCPTATGTSATGVRRTEWNQTEEGEEKFPPPLNHQTQNRLQPLRPPVHNPLSQTQTRLQRLRPPVHNPLSQTQTRLQRLRPPVHNPLSQTQTRLQPLRPPVHNPLSQTPTSGLETFSPQPPQPDTDPTPGPPLTNRSHECLLNNIKACQYNAKMSYMRTLLAHWKTSAEEPKPPKGKTIKKLAQTSQKRTNNEPSQKCKTQQANKSHCSYSPRRGG
ncbi:uncharacterized protein LOC115129986 [Oncorhynchus nerka]|uniref:uncharacterized protein LOC115129986 n=1 Tax=Oncorhynchus nerka TaxID=8023 RepID=UPI0031B8A786